MRWYLKCAVDNLKGLVPGQELLRKCKRQILPYRAMPGRADFAIEEGIRLINLIRSSRDLLGADCVEIGSGWEPLIPILFSLCGAQRVILTDLHRLCCDETFGTAIAGLRRNRNKIVSGLGLNAQAVDRRLESAPGNMVDGFREFRLEYLAPCDCTQLPIPEASIDVVYSRAVLEHVEPDVLEGIFLESRRILADTGVVCHFIDPSDHWEHSDKNISRINFLRYSDEAFRWTYLNPLNYHNRLRHSEYARVLRQTGFEILKEERIVDPRAVEFARIGLARKFQTFDLEDLATVDSFFLAEARMRR
jgi:SAM-dependent methyltransferase